MPQLALIVPPLLADAVTESSIGAWIIPGAFVIGALATLLNLAAMFATKRDVDSLTSRVSEMEKRTSELSDRLPADMAEVERRLNSASEIRSEKLHQRLDKVMEGLARLEGEVHAS